MCSVSDRNSVSKKPTAVRAFLSGSCSCVRGLRQTLKHLAKVSETLRLGGSMDQHVVNIQLKDAVSKDFTRHTALKIGPSSL